MNESFVPVALKAALVNRPPAGAEGKLYAEIGRSKPAPQGICVADSSGKVLAWALSFDEEKSVLNFFKHARSLYGSAAKAHPTERYRRFPSQRLADTPDNGTVLAIPEKGTVAALPKVPLGTLDARLVGRAFDKEGRPSIDAHQQDRYVEDRFDIRPELLHDLKPGPLPTPLAEQLVRHAYLGMLDVAPTHIEKAAFTAVAMEGGLRIEGASRAVGGEGRQRVDGATHEHAATLRWRGFGLMRDGVVTRLVLFAEGRETGSWRNAVLEEGREPDVAHLMAGRRFDLDAPVQYGIIAEPAAADRILAPGERDVDSGDRDLASRIRAKVTRLQAALGTRRDEGEDLAPIGRIMSDFEPHMRAGRFEEAEELLDRALELVAEK